jgi:hypothetical protein
LRRLNRFANFELFGLIFDAMAAVKMAEVKEILNYLFQNIVRPVDDHGAPQSPDDFGRRGHFAATGAPSGHRAQG